MDTGDYARCTQRGCINFGLWHDVTNTAHRARTLHTALAAVTVEKPAEDAPWTVWMTPHGQAKVGPLMAPPEPSPDGSHEDYMELRGAVLYALRSAEQFSA